MITRLNRMSRREAYLTGNIICIGLAEAAHLAAVFAGRSFSDCKILFWGMLLAAVLAAVAVFLVTRREKGGRRRRTSPARRGRNPEASGAESRIGGETLQRGVYALFGFVVLVQILRIAVDGCVVAEGDITAETVQSILATNGVYRVNPLTGAAYTAGIPLRYKILCLPTLYAIVSGTFGLAPETVVFRIVPVFVLCSSYVAYDVLGEALFGKKNPERGLFLLAVAVLFSFGDYTAAMDGFGLLHAGYAGTAIRAGILLPFTFAEVLRRRWAFAGLCVLAEACIVWTLYGAGACLFAAAGMGAASWLLSRKLFFHRGKESAG